MPLARSPAIAPASPGLVGAPCRKASNMHAKGPMDRNGIRIKQNLAFAPTSLGSQVKAGITMSSAATATASSAGAANQAHAQMPVGTPGRARRESSPAAVAARVNVTANFSKTRAVCSAWPMSGRTSIQSRNAAAAMIEPSAMAPERICPKSHFGSRQIDNERTDQIFGSHWPLPRYRAASVLMARCSATRTAPSLMFRRSAVSRTERPSTDKERTKSR